MAENQDSLDANNFVAKKDFHVGANREKRTTAPGSNIDHGYTGYSRIYTLANDDYFEILDNFHVAANREKRAAQGSNIDHAYSHIYIYLRQR